jgi:hypothetical protein
MVDLKTCRRAGHDLCMQSTIQSRATRAAASRSPVFDIAVNVAQITNSVRIVSGEAVSRAHTILNMR